MPQFNPEIFQFTLNPAAILSFLAAIIDIYVLYTVNNRPYITKAAKWFNLIILQGAVWAIFEGLNRASNNVQGAIVWESISWLGWIFMGPVILGVAFEFTGKENLFLKLRNQILFFAPGVVVLFLAWTTNWVFDRDTAHWVRLSYGQWVMYTEPVFNYFALNYVTILGTIGTLMIFNFYRKQKDAKKRSQAFYLSFGLSIPLIGASITNGIFMIIYYNNIIRLGSVWIAISDIVWAYAVLKFELLSANPATFVNNIVETVNEILLVLNSEHKIEYINNAFETILGYKKEDIIGKNIDFLFHTQWPYFFTTILHPIESGQVPSIHSAESEIISSTGEKIPVNISISPYIGQNGKIISTIEVISDIRQLKQLLNITGERNKLKAMMESISDGILALDTKGNVVLVNSAASYILGLYPQDIIGKSLEDIITIFDIDSKSIDPSDLLPKKSEDQNNVVIKKSEIKIITVNGKQLYANLTSSIIKEGSQVGLGAILTLHDISKEKALDEMKLDFVSMAAHELRTPLTVIIGYLSIYSKNYGDKFDIEQKKYFDRMSQASQSLRILTDNLLNVTRIERGTFVVNLAVMEWTEFVKQTTNSLQEIAKNKKIDLQFIPPNKTIPPIYADKVRIGEVLINLIDNAIKYTDPNGSIRVWIDIYGDSVVTHVADNGKGISANALPYLFTKFFRVTKNLVQSSTGTGLGLYISKGIVEKHQGKIWVQSVPGRGSIFSFSLPIQYKNPALPIN